MIVAQQIGDHPAAFGQDLRLGRARQLRRPLGGGRTIDDGGLDDQLLDFYRHGDALT